MLKKYILALSLSLVLAPAAFADEVVTSDALADETTAVEVTEDAVLCGGGCGYWGGVYINVNTVVSAEVDGISLYGNLYIDNSSSKTDAVDDLNAAYKKIQTALSKYGVVNRTGIYTYADWEYTNMFDGSLSIKVTLNNPTQVEGVENIMYEQGFDAWREVTVVSNTEAEKAAVPTLKGLISDKKEVYEELLGSMLGSVSNINIYSWADSTSYNATTNTVDVMVSADVTYNMAE